MTNYTKTTRLQLLAWSSALLLGTIPLWQGARPAHAQSTTLTVSAAASLKDALTAIGRDYSASHPQTRVNFNFGSSGTLQKQIEQGAPADVFISAADQQMDALQRQHLIEASTRRNMAGNTLVLIVPRDGSSKVHRFKDAAAPQVARIAIGGPTVPAGMRAQEVFTRLSVWPAVSAKAVRGKDVREVLTQVELGNVDAGVVYGTDAAISPKVRVVATAPQTMHKPIRYPLAVLRGSSNRAVARDFAAYVTSSQAKAVLRKYKFLVK